MRVPVLLAALLLLINGAEAASKATVSRRIGTQAQIISRILSEYDPNTRPPVRDFADHSAIVVIANIYINRVAWLDGGRRAEIDIYLRQQWEDSRLRYEVDHREGIDEVALPVGRKIWMPDTYFSSAKELDEPQPSNIFIESSGFVRTSERRRLQLPVTGGNSFPFSHQRSFTLRLSSYRYNIDDIVYLWANSPPLVSPVEVAPEVIVSNPAYEEAWEGDCVGNYTVGTYSCVEVTVQFGSGTFGGLAKWFLPSLFLLVASWLHFWVHGSWSVPRTASAAIPFFLFAVLFIFFPEVATAPGLCCWLIFCLFMTFFSFIEYFVVICCGARRSTIRYISNGRTEESMTREEVVVPTSCATVQQRNVIDVISRIAFPVVTLIFLIIYFFVIL